MFLRGVQNDPRFAAFCQGPRLGPLTRKGVCVCVCRLLQGIWYVVGSVPLLSEMLMLVLDRLHRLALFVILCLDVLIVAAAFVCAALLGQSAHSRLTAGQAISVMSVQYTSV